MVETTIEIEGTSYELKYPNRAVRQIDRKLGYSAMHLLEKASETGAMAAFSMDDIATIIWGGMLHGKPGLQLDQVVDMIPVRLDKFGPIAEQVFRIIMEVYGLEGDVTVSPAEEEPEGNLGEGLPGGTGSEPSA